MKQKRFYQISILVTTAILTIGCSNHHAPKPIQQPISAVNKPVRVVPQKPTGITLSQLNSGGVTKLSLKGSHKYKQGEPIQFIIDTKNADGYLYIIYADNKGQTGLLYPNPNSPLSEISGKYIFPRDFGNMAINATKDCKTCEQEKTVIYALLSKEPIVDIKNINLAQLSSVVGGQTSQVSTTTKTKGLSMDINAGTRTDNSNVNIGIFEFFVK